MRPTPPATRLRRTFPAWSPLNVFSIFCHLWVFSGAPGVAVAADLFRDPFYDVSVQRNLVYGQGDVGNPKKGTIDLTLDLYEPNAPPGLRPAVVFVHGGSFTSGDKSDFAALSEQYASRGYVATTINYRLESNNPTSDPEPTFSPGTNVAMDDAVQAVNWIRNNAVTYGIDPNRVAIGGFSAGAITALFEGYYENGEGARVGAVIDLAGGLYGYENWIDVDDPPLFIVHGTQDLEVPFSEAQHLVDRVQSIGLPYEFNAIPSGGHAMFLTTVVDGKTIQQRSIDFLYQHLDLPKLPQFVGGPTTEWIQPGSSWSWFAGTTEPSPFPQLGWATVGFDDAGWNNGSDGFGYGPHTDTRQIATPLAEMRSNYSTLYVRHRFAAADVADVAGLMLDIDYDDGFVAYLNGVEVARSHQGVSGAAAPFNARADASSQFAVPLRTFIDLKDLSGVLREGADNVLAIQGINRTATDSDFVLSRLGLSAVHYLPGDANGDWRVDLGDFGILRAHFGQAGSRAEGDFSRDGKIDLADFGLLKASFGKVAVAAPEPESLLLAGWACACLFLTRLRLRRRFELAKDSLA